MSEYAKMSARTAAAAVAHVYAYRTHNDRARSARVTWLSNKRRDELARAMTAGERAELRAAIAAHPEYQAMRARDCKRLKSLAQMSRFELVNTGNFLFGPGVQGFIQERKTAVEPAAPAPVPVIRRARKALARVLRKLANRVS